MSGRLDDQKRLMLAISESDDAAIGRIVQTALRQGAGVNTIIDRIVRAHQGLFHPRKYSQNAFDLVALVYKIGGPRLAFAVAKAMQLPSISTIHTRLSLPQLCPSVGFPTKDELMANIQAFFGPEVPKPESHVRSGLSLMIDEIAIEPRLRYSINQDSVIGMCREHGNSSVLGCLSNKKDTLQTLLEVQAQLESGECHRATEATMAAIARFGASDYNPALILASGTCKAEKAPDQARWIELILQSWRDSPFGEATHGPIWSICTDGDAKRRLAVFQHCMQFRLPPSSEIFGLIGHLPLLNLYCGPNLITHDGDYKHEEKRLASAMRSRSGMLVNGAHITPKMLVKYLRGLENLSESRILSFFDGTDPQNVPKANALLTNLYLASQLSAISCCPENKPFVLLGELLGSFVLPYTDPSMSLSDQITSLAKCGHLLFALYCIDGTKFISGQLIYDIEASIKNVMFCVAKTQILDPALPFYLLQTGTDRLESRFGTYRTTTSDRNGDLLQMSERAAGVQHVDQIFSAHPGWNRVPYRLSLNGKSGVDHTNPASWTSDITVGVVNIYECWLKGQSQAAELLKWAGAEFEFNPTVLAIASPNIDLMRPFGMYPGIQVDASEADSSPIPLAELTDHSNSTPVENRAPTASLSSVGRSQIMPPVLGDDELTIEHLLPPTPYDEPESTSKGWILVKGKPVHLESAVRLLLGTDSGPKSTDRLRRVCGFTRFLNPSSNQKESILGNEFQVSDLVATLIRTSNQVALIVIRVTNIIASDGRVLEAISERHFAEPGIILSGQPLELRFGPDLGSGEDSGLDLGLGVWYWTKRYDTARAIGTSSYRKREVGFDFEARFSRPISPELVQGDSDSVWVFSHNQLQELMSELWGICANMSPEEKLPLGSASTTFPYETMNKEISLVHPEATSLVQQAIRPETQGCFLCSEHVNIKRDMRTHIGRHLLSLMANSTLGSNFMASMPCGFCGRSGIQECHIRVERKPNSTRSLHVVSDCRYKAEFPYAITSRLSKTNPCSNRPVPCPRCPAESTFIWSYNMRAHALHAHGVESLHSNSFDFQQHDPSPEEYSLMHVNKETGALELPINRKRKRVNKSDSSSHKQKL
ncbi:unnamed protein product [Rhizoctonia solani]|uniref:Uncharacterized protein n=1 Tax=Rhizoctonia solani TaxID=456999 RepID=A0A8H3DXP8_9AGAM|nr:unnamed protein product [Rhizoctonia solani]